MTWRNCLGVKPKPSMKICNICEAGLRSLIFSSEEYSLPQEFYEKGVAEDSTTQVWYTRGENLMSTHKRINKYVYGPTHR